MDTYDHRSAHSLASNPGTDGACSPAEGPPLLQSLAEVRFEALSPTQQQVYARLSRLAAATWATRMRRFNRYAAGEPLALPATQGARRSRLQSVSTGAWLNTLHPDPKVAARWERELAEGFLRLPTSELLTPDRFDDSPICLIEGELRPEIRRRKRLSSLPAAWVESAVAEASTSSPCLRHALLVMALTGCRPSEVKTAVIDVSGDELYITLDSAKLIHAGIAVGALQRDFRIRADGYPYDAWIRELRNWVASIRTIRPFSSVTATQLANLCTRLSRRLWPRLKPGMNPSCFRSQFAADLKAAGVPREVIASYMGHETPETMSKYGTWRQGKGGRRGYLVVDSQRQQESRRNTSGSRGGTRRAFPRGG